MFFRTRKLIWGKYRHRKNRYYTKIFLAFFLLLLFLTAGSFWKNADSIEVSTNNTKDSVSNYEKVEKILNFVGMNESELRDILGQGCPLFIDNEKEGSVTLLNYFSDKFINITEISKSEPTSYLKYQLAYLSNVSPVGVQMVHGGEEDFYLETPPELEEWNFEVKKDILQVFDKDSVILLYNTHNAENYKPEAAKLEGQNAGVFKVAQRLKQKLEDEYGAKVVQSENIHDYPDWTRSYIESLKTAQQLLGENKNASMMFDIHRDAGYKSKDPTTININGKNAAKILLVIATEHENWKKNLAFAQQLESKSNELYPGLIRDIRIRDNRRYNQQLHPQAVLLEFGSDLNTLDEALYSAELLADIIANVVKKPEN
ncbi:stage II sporulation protein P [Desulfonispora thiosulfatigenes DSM 11270]|uniref:Stage II sporulation protein P n=1 Tax=Desulfonispora thiosulfatigenes DSM 11270 TaxID=656914 RepID=A0A1W1VBW4_DESTI|nr:stage II sporulation protein P [Desulfonispora thiosulfatigenes]SMB90848.1 stage II sporulation protein P [Desulfonispora thiosulfatigenes DSM 11270]